MTAALIVGGDQIDGIKQVLASHGIDSVTHWSGRKVGDGRKVIPGDTQLIILVTNWISHNFTHKIKQTAAKRGLKIVYTPNGPAALNARLKHMNAETAKEVECSQPINQALFSTMQRIKQTMAHYFNAAVLFVFRSLHPL